MSRSKWKGIFTEPKLLNLVAQTDLKKTKEFTLDILDNLNLRNSTILKNFLGIRFDVYNGKIYNSVLITQDMIGHKFGEFHYSCKVGKIKKYVKQRKKGYKKAFKLKKRPRTLRPNAPRRTPAHHY